MRDGCFCNITAKFMLCIIYTYLFIQKAVCFVHTYTLYATYIYKPYTLYIWWFFRSWNMVCSYSCNHVKSLHNILIQIHFDLSFKVHRIDPFGKYINIERRTYIQIYIHIHIDWWCVTIILCVIYWLLHFKHI